ncbi:hypothetical protein FQZ97_1107550 [compost metagenome]
MNPCQACVDQKGQSFRVGPHQNLVLVQTWEWPGGPMGSSHTDRLYQCSTCGHQLFWSNEKMGDRTWS